MPTLYWLCGARENVLIGRLEATGAVNQVEAELDAALIAAAHDRLDALARQRAAVIAELPAEFVELYERQRERYGVGASFLQRGITSASGVQLSPSQLEEVRLADPDAVLMCPDSNAILIRTEDSGL